MIEGAPTRRLEASGWKRKESSIGRRTELEKRNISWMTSERQERAWLFNDLMARIIILY